MRHPSRTVVLLCTLGLLAGCGESRLNPFNWFGAPAPQTLEPDVGYAKAAADNRAMAAEVTALKVEQVHGGVILRATAVPPTQGWWDAELRPVEQAGAFKGEAVDGVLSFELVLSQPLAQAQTGAPQSREIEVGKFISVYDLTDVQQISVSGANGARVIRP